MAAGLKPDGRLKPHLRNRHAKRHHIQVVDQPGALAEIGAAAMGQSVVPDDEIARLPRNGHRPERMEILPPRIRSRRERGQPFRQSMLETRDQGKGPLLRGCVRKIEDTLSPKRDG